MLKAVSAKTPGTTEEVGSMISNIAQIAQTTWHLCTSEQKRSRQITDHYLNNTVGTIACINNASQPAQRLTMKQLWRL